MISHVCCVYGNVLFWHIFANFFAVFFCCLFWLFFCLFFECALQMTCFFEYAVQKSVAFSRGWEGEGVKVSPRTACCCQKWGGIQNMFWLFCLFLRQTLMKINWLKGNYVVWRNNVIFICIGFQGYRFDLGLFGAIQIIL